MMFAAFSKHVFVRPLSHKMNAAIGGTRHLATIADDA